MPDATTAATPAATTAPTPTPTPAATSKTAKPKSLPKVRPVYGPMVNLLTDQRIDGITEVPEIDGFLQAQIDAGKLELV